MQESHDADGPPGSLQTVSSIIHTAIEAGHTEMLKRYRMQIIERILTLTSSVIETTSKALRTDTLEGGTITVTERHTDPNHLISSKRHDRLSMHNNKSLDISSHPNAIRAKSFPSEYDTVVSSSHNVKSNKRLGSKYQLNSSSATAAADDGGGGSYSWRFKEVMCLTGRCDLNLHFLESEALGDDEIQTVLSRLLYEDREEPQHIQDSYYELLHVQSYSMEAVPSSSFLPQTVINEGRCIRSGCFTKALYTYCATEDNYVHEAASSMMSDKKNKNDAHIKYCNVSSFRPIIQRSIRGSIPAQSLRKVYEGFGRHRAASQPRVKGEKSMEVVTTRRHEKERMNALAVVWQPISHLSRSKLVSGDADIKEKREDQQKHTNSINRHFNNSNNNVINDEIYITTNAKKQSVPHAETRVYKISFTSPSYTRLNETGKCRIYHEIRAPIDLRVVSPEPES